MSDFNECEKKTEIKRKWGMKVKWDDKYKNFGTKGHAVMEGSEPPNERFMPYYDAFHDWLEEQEDDLGDVELQFGRLSTDPPEQEEFLFRGFPMLGFIDGVTKKKRIPYDHKFTSDPRRVKVSWQDKFYMAACEELGWDVDTSTFHYLIYKRDSGFNFVEFIDRPFKTGDLDYWKDRSEALLKRHKEAWETGIFIPNLSSCSGCEVREFCSVHGGQY